MVDMESARNLLLTPSPCPRGGLGRGLTYRRKNHFDLAGQRLLALEVYTVATRLRHLSFILSLDKERNPEFILAFRLVTHDV